MLFYLKQPDAVYALSSISQTVYKHEVIYKGDNYVEPVLHSLFQAKLDS